MKKWEVYASSKTIYSIEVMAENEHDAIDMAINIDAGEWKEVNADDWNVDWAEEIKE
jgi:hypothetical protein